MPVIRAVSQLNTGDDLNLHIWDIWPIEHRIVKKCHDFHHCGRGFTRFSRAILLNETVFNSDELILQGLQAIAS